MGHEDVMTSIGLVGLWTDGEVIAYGTLIAMLDPTDGHMEQI